MSFSERRPGDLSESVTTPEHIKKSPHDIRSLWEVANCLNLGLWDHRSMLTHFDFFPEKDKKAIEKAAETGDYESVRILFANGFKGLRSDVSFNFEFTGESVKGEAQYERRCSGFERIMKTYFDKYKDEIPEDKVGYFNGKIMLARKLLNDSDKVSTANGTEAMRKVVREVMDTYMQRNFLLRIKKNVEKIEEQLPHVMNARVQGYKNGIESVQHGIDLLIGDDSFDVSSFSQYRLNELQKADKKIKNLLNNIKSDYKDATGEGWLSLPDAEPGSGALSLDQQGGALSVPDTKE